MQRSIGTSGLGVAALPRIALRRTPQPGSHKLNLGGTALRHTNPPRRLVTLASAGQDKDSSAPSASAHLDVNALAAAAVDAGDEAIADAVDATADAIDATALEATQQQKQLALTTAPADVPPPPTGLVPRARVFVADNPIAGYSIAGIVGFLGVTFLVAVFRTVTRGVSPTGKRRRTVNKNKTVVEELGSFLPANRQGLTGTVIAGLRLRTGFSPVEIYRKYLWFLLRERKFDQDAVADMVALKGALKLSDDDVAAALGERAKRVYEKYGNVMLDTEGMSASGVERKATARALFSKLLFLVECEDLLPADKAAEGVQNLRDIFGATEDDASRLRIASLYEVDLDAAMGLPDAQGSQGDGDDE